MRVDIDSMRASLDGMADLLRTDDTAGHVRPRVVTTLVSDVHSRSDFVQYGKEFSFESDESAERAGEGSAPSPLRYFLSGIAFCLQVWHVKGAAVAGCEIEDLEIEVSTYMDMRGEHLIDDVPPYPQWIEVETRVTSPSPADRVVEMSDQAFLRCPVSALVARAVPLRRRLVHNGTVLRDDTGGAA